MGFAQRRPWQTHAQDKHRSVKNVFRGQFSREEAYRGHLKSFGAKIETLKVLYGVPFRLIQLDGAALHLRMRLP
ncbi:hypothetical protein IAD21_00336 [Abditibacteriota bacterium]|nr:hypothetical protein IAD21_00336 [Abditibacteriota bacterium]